MGQRPTSLNGLLQWRLTVTERAVWASYTGRTKSTMPYKPVYNRFNNRHIIKYCLSLVIIRLLTSNDLTFNMVIH